VKRLALVLGLLAFGAAEARAQQDTSRVTSSGSYSASGEEGWLGMGISCSQCSFEGPGWAFARRSQAYVTSGERRWTFSQPPLVYSVENDGPADRAGLRSGDTLISVDGYPLTSVEGGRRFANIQPGQAVSLKYGRDGKETEVRVTAGKRPRSAVVAYQDSLRTLARAQERQREQLTREMERAREAQQRSLEQSQEALERQREYMERAMEQLQEVEGRFTDSTRQEAVQRTRAMLDSAVARWRVAESLYAQLPTPPVAPRALTPPAGAPPAGWAPVAPTPPIAMYAPVAPLTYAEHRNFGPLRFAGGLGDVVIEARSPYAATATEVSDSEVVVTSRDLSVRVAIRPRPTPAPRAEAAPKPARAPRPAPTPRPPKPAQEPIE